LGGRALRRERHPLTYWELGEQFNPRGKTAALLKGLRALKEKNLLRWHIIVSENLRPRLNSTGAQVASKLEVTETQLDLCDNQPKLIKLTNNLWHTTC
jgi:hypothetical protein